MNSNILNNNSSLIHFNKDRFYYPLKNNVENVSVFMEKSRIIRREKIRRYTLEDKRYALDEERKEQFKLIKIYKDEYFKNLKMFLKFRASYNGYLRFLEKQIIRQRHIDNNLKKQKDKLQRDKDKLDDRIKFLEKEIIKYKSIKKFLDSGKYDYEDINRKDTEKEDISLFITETNDVEKSNNSNNLLTESFASQKKFKKQYTKNINIHENGDNIRIRKYNSTGLINNYNKIIRKEREKNKLKNIFLNVENSIINNINSFNEKRYKIFELKNDLSKAKSFIEGEYYYDSIKISSKVMKVFFLKKDNKTLKSKFNSIKKIYAINEDFKNKLEKKIYFILINLNKGINIEEKLCIKNIFFFLKLKKDEFFEKMKINKVIYMIKIIELLSSYLINLKIKYENDPLLKNEYEIVLNEVEKEKNVRMIKLNKRFLIEKLENKKLEFIKKTNEVRAFHYKKYDIKYNKSKNLIMKTHINSKNDSKSNYYEQWLTYN